MDWEKEIAFWGIHQFQENWWSLGCSLCGFGIHDPVHAKAEEEN